MSTYQHNRTSNSHAAYIGDISISHSNVQPLEGWFEMNEDEWLHSTDPASMLRRLATPRCSSFWNEPTSYSNGLTFRKIRLIACGCCRVVWDNLDSRSQDAVEVAEFIESDRPLFQEASIALDAAEEAYQEDNRPDIALAAATLRSPLYNILTSLRDYFSLSHIRHCQLGQSTTQGSILASMIRDIIGNPWKLTHRLSIQKEWLTRDILGIVNTIYSEYRFDLMPILADALEEAGCTEPLIINHCRNIEECPKCWGFGRCIDDKAVIETFLKPMSRERTEAHIAMIQSGIAHRKPCDCSNGFVQTSNPHYRGCWVADRLLEKD